MFEGFEEYCVRAKRNWHSLKNANLHLMRERPKGLNIPAIYVFYENGIPVYVGRTNNLTNRLRNHVTVSHNSASFALKRTRELHQLKATYQKNGSRAEIVKHPVFGQTFRKEIDAIKDMRFRFLRVDDHFEQYLTELLITMELNLDTSGFYNS